MVRAAKRLYNKFNIKGFAMSVAFTFPGQGSQRVGMGKELADNFATAREVFQEVNDALDQDLTAIMWDGPESDLTLTENAQPAIMAASIAAFRVLESDFGFKMADEAKLIAGHSLGEYTALAAAGTFSLADTARLLKTRGKAMQAATPVGTGAMAALLGLDFDAVVEVAAKVSNGDVCQAANDNGPGQVVVSGTKAAVERACELAKQAGARRAVMLPISAPFHCSLMAPAADVMAKALANVDMATPSVPLVANVSTQILTDPAAIRLSLVEQVTGTVRWRESMVAMAADGIDVFVELGAGRVLTGMVRRNTPGAKGVTIGLPDEFEKAINEIKGS